MRKSIVKIVTFTILTLSLFSCKSNKPAEINGTNGLQPFGLISKPYTRYWWFASMIKKEDIRYNLDWLKTNGFGGVEIAWVYPLNRFNPPDTTYTPRQEWLSREWQEITRYALEYADSIGLGCDFTFGTLWPFGDSQVSFEQATRRFGDPGWRQEITRNWEHPRPGYVIDHLTPNNYLPYFNRLANVFPRMRTKTPSAWFIDSWEVETQYLWAEGFERDFRERFGYDITLFMDSIYLPENKKQLYDYMVLLSEKVLGFYRDFDKTLNDAGVLSRGQVSGAPCDLISGYASLDIPEGESMLFEPEFCAIPASAALLSGKKVVSAETFTCLYGWPRDYIREEQTADLKLVADALFANGINQVIWHGKPHNPAGSDSVNFYATVHAGPSGSLAKDIPAFNRYLETVSEVMKKGHTYSDVAVWLPTDDAWCAGILPEEKQFIWAWGYYEMRYTYFPEELKGFNPAWINAEFLEKGRMEDGRFHVGDASFDLLYFDAEYLDYRVVRRLAKLAGEGMPIVLKRLPREPGTILHDDYNQLLEKIAASRPGVGSLPEGVKPFITGKEIPGHWCRTDGESLYLFFPNPKSYRLKFPLEYGHSFDTITRKLPVKIVCKGVTYDLDLTFEPYQSLLFKLDKGKSEQLDIQFVPSIPAVKQRPAGSPAPWLVRKDSNH